MWVGAVETFFGRAYVLVEAWLMNCQSGGGGLDRLGGGHGSCKGKARSEEQLGLEGLLRKTMCL